MASKSNSASQEEQAIVSTVKDFLAGMTTKSEASMKALCTIGGSVALYRDGKVVHHTLEQFIARAMVITTHNHVVEIMHDIEVNVDGDIAMVWAPFECHFDGQLHH